MAIEFADDFQGERNLIMPGNPRYQPKQLRPIFGYDNTYRGLARVELATMDVFGDIGLIPADDYLLLTEEIREKILRIRATDVDELERSVTKHDVRAWIRLAQEILPEPLRQWLHLLLTSYDPLDTGRRLQYLAAYHDVLKPLLKKLIRILAAMVRQYAEVLQVGRTHGQHALPITVGFWLATILYRLVYNAQELDRSAAQLVGKISGAVGAYNAQVGLGILERCGERSFEERVLDKLNLQAAPISTQILSPEPLSYFLHSCTLLTATIAQLCRDCRHLMRSEIAEVQEVFESGQIGSSTMANKINPISFENGEGMYIRTVPEYLKVLNTLVSEHQRDLVGSSVARDFPIIVINLTQQLNTLLREKGGKTFLERITINEEVCRRNFDMSGALVMSEPLYIALQMAGYPGDAHEIVAHRVAPYCRAEGGQLIDIVRKLAADDEDLATVLSCIPEEVQQLLRTPENYTGRAAEKAREIAGMAEAYIAN